MPQPGTLPRWAETLSGTQAANVVGPPAGKQDTGYATGGDIPTSGGLNWLFRWIYKWCQYVAGLTGEALTWTARQTFSGGATVVDPPVSATDAASMGYVDAEATARAAAVAAEATARAAADTTEATTRAAADSAEATARANGDALLMPLAGGTFTGAPSYAADPGGNNVLARKSYIDGKVFGRTNLPTVGQQIGGSSGAFGVSTTPAQVTNASVTLTTSGRPVQLAVQSAGAGAQAYFEAQGAGNTMFLRLKRDGTEIASVALSVSGGTQINVPPCFDHLDVPAAGTHTYTLEASMGAGFGIVNNCALMAYEL